MTQVKKAELKTQELENVNLLMKNQIEKLKKSTLWKDSLIESKKDEIKEKEKAFKKVIEDYKRYIDYLQSEKLQSQNRNFDYKQQLAKSNQSRMTVKSSSRSEYKNAMKNQLLQMPLQSDNSDYLKQVINDLRNQLRVKIMDLENINQKHQKLLKENQRLIKDNSS